MKAIALAFLLFPRGAQAYEMSRYKNNEAPMQLYVATVENDLTTDNAWAATEAAFQRVRVSVPATKEDQRDRELAVKTYNESLAPSLRKLRNSTFCTVRMTLSLVMSMITIDFNARKGVMSIPRGVYDFEAGNEKTPRPVATKDLLELNALANREAEEARITLEKALARLERVDAAKLSLGMRDAHESMEAALRKSIAAANSMGGLGAKDGAMAEVIRGEKEYMDLVNRELRRDEPAYKALVLKSNTAMRAYARAGSELASDLEQAKLLHVDIDRLGTL